MLCLLIGPNIRNIVLRDFGHISMFSLPLVGEEDAWVAALKFIADDKIAAHHLLNVYLKEHELWNSCVSRVFYQPIRDFVHSDVFFLNNPTIHACINYGDMFIFFFGDIYRPNIQ